MKSTPVLLAAAILFATAAQAQTDCSMASEGTKARCEEAMRVKKACAGLEGDALKTCQQKNVRYGETSEDCSKLSGELRLSCERHNRSMSAAAPCSGKTGTELDACAKAQAAARGAPK